MFLSRNYALAKSRNYAKLPNLSDPEGERREKMVLFPTLSAGFTAAVSPGGRLVQFPLSLSVVLAVS